MKIQSSLSITFCVVSFLIALGCDQRTVNSSLQSSTEPEVIAYYSGGKDAIDQHDLRGVSQLIYSFLHLKGNELAIDNTADSLTLMHLTGLKKKYPQLKVLVSLGGWGGCKTCSDVFSSPQGRKDFAESTAQIIADYNADGIDLDWEYPVVQGSHGHPVRKDDKDNFTELVKALKKEMQPNDILSFAAGGFPAFMEQSIDWAAVMPLISHVNIMSYDLYNSKKTGHHTPLYSNTSESRSTDRSVQYLLSIGVPADQIVIGAAFYGRIWENVPDQNNGLFQPAQFKRAIGYKNFDRLEPGYEFYWDDVAKAPYCYHPEKKLFLSFDDARSITLKTQYAMENKLKGIMFWELANDRPNNGLLKAMVKASQSSE